ncbi:MAG: hypothetical protein HOW73_08905 [Polyangiaceae bacterium]|nr:hypothetical protein [Polyangiaceae bacterium]
MSLCVSRALTLGAFAVLAALTGCSPDVEGTCVDWCESASSCEGAGEVDCSSVCSQQANAAEEVGCEEEAVALLDCYSAEGVCETDLQIRCEDEVNDAFACVIDFCLENPADSLCQDDQQPDG